MTHKFKISDKVIYTNDFGVWWGVKIIEQLDKRSGKPTYFHKDTDTPWFSIEEDHYQLAEPEDLTASSANLQKKYGFVPTEWYGCY